MEQVGGMHVLEAFQALVNNVLLVNIFQDIGSDHCVQVGVHKVEYQVDVAIILGSHHILQSNNVFVAGQFLQEDDLTEGALGVCCVLEGIEVLFERHNLLGPLVNSFPHDTVSSLAYRIVITLDWRQTYLISGGFRTS